jgi:PAS domain S-box-containing protein
VVTYAYVLYCVEALFVAWCFWRCYRHARLDGYAVAGSTAVAGFILVSLSIVQMGDDVRNFVVLPLFNIPIVVSFLLVAYQRIRHQNLAIDLLLRQSEERFSKAFHRSPVASSISRMSDGKLLDVNQATADLFGYRCEEIINRASTDLGAWANSADREQFVALLKSEGRVSGLESSARTKSGEIIILRIYAQLIEMNGEQCVLATAIDVTAERRQATEIRNLANTLEQKVRDRTAELQRANAELDSFSYSVSHDLRAPVRAIGGFSSLLTEALQGALDPEQLDYLHRIAKSAAHMDSLIDGLLKLSRVGQQPIEQGIIDLSKESNSALEALRVAYPARRVECAIAPGILVKGDRALLRVLLDNLLGNAWKYTAMKDPARLTMRLGKLKVGTPAVVVEDNGVGFDMRYVGRLFQPFQRLHSATEFEGSGIGLSIVKRIVERHGGFIEVQSSPGVGTTFSVSLSIVANSPESKVDIAVA